MAERAESGAQLRVVEPAAPREELEELRRVFAELREREKQLAQAQRLARLGGWEWHLATDGMRWTDELYRIFGLHPGSVEPDVDELLARVDPADRDRVERNLTAARRSGTGFQHQYRLRRDDGEERLLLAHVEPMLDEQGAVRSLLGTVQDVTARKEMEARELQLAQEQRARVEAEWERRRLARMFEQAPAVISITRGPDHVFELTNPAFRRLLGGRDVIGLAVAEAFPDLEGRAFLRLLDEVYESAEPYTAHEVPAPVETEKGETIEGFFNFVYQPLFGPDDRVTGIMIHGVEITGQVQARRQVEEKATELARMARALETTNRALERSNRELDQFAYVASHDLKAPLRGIANLSQWIEEDLGEGDLPEETREHLALLRSRVLRMEALIDGLLEYSRVGRQRQAVERVDVGGLLEETVELLAPDDGAEVILPAELPVLDAERLPLSQVFLNLVSNALKHARRSDPRVEVAAEEQDEGFWRFSVSDNGPGIAPQYQDRIFGIFQTLQARDQVEGTGIGLALVKKIVETQGGRVWVESAEGEGATFHFLWPKKPKENR